VKCFDNAIDWEVSITREDQLENEVGMISPASIEQSSPPDFNPTALFTAARALVTLIFRFHDNVFPPAVLMQLYRWAIIPFSHIRPMT
jgi:hypothetical protein